MNFDVVKNIGDWLIEKVLPKATIWFGIFLAIGALTLGAASLMKLKLPEAQHPILTDAGKYFAGFWVCLAIATFIAEMRKSTKLRVAIHAEEIRMNPTVDNVSAIPEVQKEINRQTIEGGSP